MRTFLQVLRLTFWINPLQRVLTCIGMFFLVALTVASIRTQPFGLFKFAWISGFQYAALAAVANLLMCSVYWRIVSAPRIVRLAPHGRTRLLGSILGLVLLIALLLKVPFWLYILRWAQPQYYPSVAMQLAGVASNAVLPSMFFVGLFIASRSPLAALLVLLVLLAPDMAARLFDVNVWQYITPSRQVFILPGPGFILLALTWIPFAIWYLRARRISPPRWLASGGQDVLATAVISLVTPRSQREALERLLLGGTTVMRFGMQWFLVQGLLLALIWVQARVREVSDPEIVARTMYASLCICPIVTTMISFAAIRRSRALWLRATSSRVEFFALIYRTLMRLNLAMVLVFGIWLTAVWLAQPRGSGSDLKQLVVPPIFWLETLWVLGLIAICAQLARLPRWPAAILAAGMLVIVWWFFYATEPPDMTSSGVAALAAVVPLLVVTITAFALRGLAQLRWIDGDFPRAV